MAGKEINVQQDINITSVCYILFWQLIIIYIHVYSIQGILSLHGKVHACCCETVYKYFRHFFLSIVYLSVSCKQKKSLLEASS